ncbi:MAG: serine hydrolase [Pseudomonadota bacterium]
MRSPVFMVGIIVTLVIGGRGIVRAEGEGTRRVAPVVPGVADIVRPPMAPDTRAGLGLSGKTVRRSNPAAKPARNGTARPAATSAARGPAPAITAAYRSGPAVNRSTVIGSGGRTRGEDGARGQAPALEDLLAVAHPKSGGNEGKALGIGSREQPGLNAKALYCVDCKSNKVLLARNDTVPMPIASITKLLTAMVVIDKMKPDEIVEVGDEILKVEPKNVGIRPGDLFTVKDLLHGMLMESGNDCAEALALSYAKGGRSAFVREVNRKALEIGAEGTMVYTPSGLDAKVSLGRKGGTTYSGRRYNSATAKGVALIARHAMNYPLIGEISNTRHYVMQARNKRGRKYTVLSTDRLLHRPLPVAVAKTGFTNHAGRCIVALFKNEDKEHVVVVLNSPQHFKVAERIYRWAASAL